MAKYQRLARLIELVTVIKHHPAWGARQLAQYFEISEKRIYDDINTLNAANIPIVYNGAGYSFLSRPALPPAPFTREEAAALLGIGAVSEDSHGGARAGAARSAANKLFHMLPHDTQDTLRELSGRVRVDPEGAHGAGQTLSRLLNALVENRTVSLACETPNSNDETRRRVDPYAVVFRGDDWHLIGHCHLRGAMRTFRVNRITDLKETDGVFLFPDDFCLDAHLDENRSGFHGGEITVRVRFDKHAAPHIAGRQWYAGQKITRRAHGAVTFTATVRDAVEIRRWILGWGEHAEVLAPPDLRREIKAAATAMAALYAHTQGRAKQGFQAAEQRAEYKSTKNEN